MRDRLIGSAFAAVALLSSTSVHGDDTIDRLLRLGAVPADRVQQHGYSDFTDPLGRFLDLLAAGAVVDAQSIQTDACTEWLVSRHVSAFSGKVWVWNTQIDLDRLCAPR